MNERLTTALADRYTIERELGAGGMATVYLAHDIKHDRKVAIKVLKPELAAVLGAERFVVEIKTTAALQHPHILPLFDSGTADHQLFYVMPFVEGETLRSKLNRETQFGVDEAVRIAREIADALDYAHRHGVIHRDIKPENIMLHDGRPMVMDFGIALAVSAAAGGRMTETGLSLGTPHYMSPEQATADKEITGRSDIYSLGAMLYEMLAGQPPHLGGSAQQIIMKIIAEPTQPVTTLRKSVPGNVAAALTKALEKLPADRFDTAKAFSDALANTAFVTTGTGASSAVSSNNVPKSAFITVAALALILFAALAWKLLHPVSSAPAVAMHLQLLLPPGDRIGGGGGDSLRNSDRPSRTAIVFSPDGKSLVYAGIRDGKHLLFLRPLSGELSTPIAGTEGAESPFFSPNGEAIGFWVPNHLRSVAIGGGPSNDIATVDRISGASWNGDQIVVGVQNVGLILFSVTGLHPPDTLKNTIDGTLPQFVPGGKAIIYTQSLGPDSSRIEAYSLSEGHRKVLVEDAADARLIPTGHLVFGRNGTMLVASFDPATLSVGSVPVVVLGDVMQALNGANSALRSGAMQVAISPTGLIAWLTGGIGPDRRTTFSWFDRQGHETPITALGEAPYYAARLSPDESKLATYNFTRPPKVTIFDLARQTSRSLPVSTGPTILWSQDGRRILHRGTVGDSISSVWSMADGSRPAEPIAGKTVIHGSPAFWSIDGSELISLIGSSPRYRLEAVKLSDGSVREITGLPLDMRFPTLSPDGRWLAYSSQEAGSKSSDLFVQSWPTLEGKWKISNGGGNSPAWTKGGRALIYFHQIDSDQQIQQVMMVDVPAGPEFKPGIPRELFTHSIVTATPMRGYDITADGSRLIIPNSIRTMSPPGNIHLVVNWFPELRALVGAKGGGK